MQKLCFCVTKILTPKVLSDVNTRQHLRAPSHEAFLVILFLFLLLECLAEAVLNLFTIFFYFLLNHLWKCQKAWQQQKSKKDEQISAGLS